MSTRLFVLAIVALAFTACAGVAQPQPVMQPTPEVIVLAPTCTIPDRPLKPKQPGATHIQITPIGRDTQGNRVAWDIDISAINELGCSTPKVTDLVLELPAAVGRGFLLYDKNDWTIYSRGTVESDGRINLRFTPPLPLLRDKFSQQSFRLALDSSAIYGEEFVLTTNLLGYEVGGQPHQYYPLRPPSSY